MSHTRRQFALATTTLALAASFGSFSAHADDASDAKAIVDKALVTVNLFAKDPDFASMPALLTKAKGVLIYPQIIEGGFVIGGSGGTGVLLVRDEKTGNFSAPAFYSMGGISLGFLAGGQAAEVILLINTQKALDSMLSTKLKLGADAAVALGPKGAGQAASFNAAFIAYAKAKGAYASIAFDGQVIEGRDKLNAAYYGKAASPVEILVRQTVSNPGSAPLQAALKAIAK